ncbi:Aminomethyltransferase folate-binding domain-containing protein [Zopfia rhizophila CBS 207.26]|uniref:Iron-sulfur cluster assembly factor IBA57 homolog, mitochondrial n=1 Tax=Zopfia rhizophila CBS 207.26 TaxID=1314779 RepID=A0A6A6EAC6_9PEZI|nr:Aminomethyltransferase folate-binding domain-containing protein [Zopfia rhizophila CBS 207.26]
MRLLSSPRTFTSRRRRAPAAASYSTLSSGHYGHRNTTSIRIPQSLTSTAIISSRNVYRQYATSSDTGSFLPDKLAPRSIVPLLHRRLVQLSGPDASKFLQGLVTNNVDPDREDAFYSTLLDARGRVLWDVFIWPRKDDTNAWGCYIDVDAAEVGALVRHLKRHKLRSKFDIRVIDENESSVWAGWCDTQPETPLFGPNTEGLLGSVEDPRARGFGYRLLFRGSCTYNFGGQPDTKPGWLCHDEQYHLRRYLYGIPEGQKEVQRESALPMESNIDLSQGIDFKKGCYVGQELTIRTKHTGVVRKRILPVQLYREGDPVPEDGELAKYNPTWTGKVESGADIKQLDEEGSIKKGRAAGKFIASIGNVGLALCRLEMMTPIRVSAEGGTYRPGVEFGVLEGGGEQSSEKPVRIKAIVPSWLREREREMWDKGRSKGVEQVES